MQITRETDYAVRCVLFLSRSPGAILMVEDIAREMSIPRSFLAKILQKLAKADIVKSFRGVKGGFQLSRSPEKVSLLEVIEAMEGPVGMSRCAVNAMACDFSGTCSVHPVWTDVKRIVEEHLGKITFKNLKKKRRSSGKR